MDRLDEITLGDIGRTLGRYRPFIAVVVSILLVAVFLPGERTGGPADTAGQISAPGGGGGFSNDFSSGGGPTSTTGPGGVSTSGGSGGANRGGGGGGGGGQQGNGGGGPDLQAAAASGTLNPTCDPNAGHVAIPSLAAPPCVEVGPNTGNDYQGVKGDSIKVAYYQGQADPTSQAILAAAGAEDTDEEEESTARDWIDYYMHHYETYGRDVEVFFVKGSGEAEDDNAAIADARKVIAEGAFASLGAPNAAYTEELAANGVMCFECQISQPIENYQAIAPHSWGVLMASTEGYVHRAEYVGKRLAGAKAELAGDATMHLEDRKFGLLYYNNDGAYESGAAFFEEHLRNEYGVELAIRRDYEGFPKTAESQEAARPLIQAMIQEGVTSVLCACDPFAPIFFTEEASRQNYFPEWVITGSALTDTTLFARLYDKRQWVNAFGISFLTARTPERLDENLALLKWHFGPDYEPASPQYGIIRADIGLFFTGVHLAGPTLTPQTFQRGMFNMPPVGTGHITQQAISYGQQVWPFDDYTSYDDITEIWWDPNATGEDEIGSPGVGMYRYVDMGKRLLPGEQPQGPPKAFQTENTVTMYDDYPEGDRPPEYPHE